MYCRPRKDRNHSILFPLICMVSSSILAPLNGADTPSSQAEVGKVAVVDIKDGKQELNKIFEKSGVAPTINLYGNAHTRWGYIEGGVLRIGSLDGNPRATINMLVLKY